MKKNELIYSLLTISIIFVIFVIPIVKVKAEYDGMTKSEYCNHEMFERTNMQFITQFVYGGTSCNNTEKCTDAEKSKAISLCVKYFPSGALGNIKPSDGGTYGLNGNSKSSNSGAKSNTGSAGTGNTGGSNITGGGGNTSSSRSISTSSGKTGNTNTGSRATGSGMIYTTTNQGVDDMTKNDKIVLKIYDGSACSDANIALAVSVIGKIVDILKIAAPIILVLMAMIDITKAMIASDDAKMEKAKSHLIKRIISAVIIFFVITIIQIVMDLVGSGSTDTNCMKILGSPWDTSTTINTTY